jgi:hypothetical protein
LGALSMGVLHCRDASTTVTESVSSMRAFI